MDRGNDRENIYYEWHRYKSPDDEWPLIVEVRADALGSVVMIAHLQRNLPGDGRAPDFGWELLLPGPSAEALLGETIQPLSEHAIEQVLRDSSLCAVRFAEGQFEIRHPTQPLKKRGKIDLRKADNGMVSYRYYRCTASDQVPMQQAAWHRAECVLSPTSLASFTPTMQFPHQVLLDRSYWDDLYETGASLDLKDFSELENLVRYHHDAVVQSMVRGDDWGNVTNYADGSKEGSVFGMNRLNHCFPIFTEGYRSGDHRLIETAILWCDNFFDQSIWWGQAEQGGTRYNNMAANGSTPPDERYMWRPTTPSIFVPKATMYF